MVLTCKSQVTPGKALMASVLNELQDTIAGAAERVGPSVVGLGRGWGRGSGVVIAPGHVLTSAHNLRGEEATVVRADGERTGARVSATDLDLDLAVLDLDTGDAPTVEWPDEAGAP